jgi:hypothetical protein
MSLTLQQRFGRWQQRLTKIVVCCCCAARYDHREGPKVGARHFRTPTLAPLTPIHRSVWKKHSANFRFTEFSEIRIASAQHPRYEKLRVR